MSHSDSSGSDSDSDEIQRKTFLALCCLNGQLAAAYYDPVKCVLYILEDTTDYWGHFDLAKMVIEQISPTIIITSSKSDVKFIQGMRDWRMVPTFLLLQTHILTSPLMQVDTHPSPPKFLIRPKKEFNYTTALERLLSLDLLLASEATREDPLQQHSHWAARVRLNSFSNIQVCSGGVSAAGALMEFMSAQKGIHVQTDYEDIEFGLEKSRETGLEEWRFEVRNIECLSLNQTMHLNADTLTSLGIFVEESHASIHSTKGKEGLSLFGLISPHTQTPPGKRLLKHWFLRPSLSIKIIQARLHAVGVFINLGGRGSLGLKGRMKGIGSIHSAISKLSSGSGAVREWSVVNKFIENVLYLHDSFIELGFGVDGEMSEVEIVKKLFAILDLPTLRKIGSGMNEIIDWQSSNDANRLIVQPHVDDELDEWKLMLGGLDSLLSKVAIQIASEIPPGYADSINVVYFPQLGFLISIPLRDEWQNEDGLHILAPPETGGRDEFAYQFCTEQSAFFKSSKMHDLDEHIGDLHPAIVDREIEIIHTLEQKILVHKEMILAIVDVCAELDCLLAFAEVSRLYNYVCPEIVEESLLDIREGRHPLQEQVVDIFVANDVYVVAGKGKGKEMRASVNQDDSCDDGSSSGDAGDGMDVDGEEDKTDGRTEGTDFGMRKERSVVICTGANACGKSVYLKQAALIVFMAQTGCFVPAAYAKIGIVDKIFGRIQTRESVSKAQSAFMTDLNQVSLALRNITPRSLLIVDEFGKGTLATDGAGLFCGLVKYLLELGAQCPRTLIATHFHEVFRDDEALISPLSLPISFIHMQILLTTVDGNPIDVRDEDGPGENAGVQQGDGITYLYKATPGLCLSSYAAHCALAFGIPFDVVSRARKVTDAVARHAIQEIVDDKMTAEEERELEIAEAVCRRFLAWDISADMERMEENDIDVMGKLREVLGERWEEEASKL